MREPLHRRDRDGAVLDVQPRRRSAGGAGCPSGTSSITGVAFYTGTQFPAEYTDALFIADYARRCIIVMRAGAERGARTRRRRRSSRPTPRARSTSRWARTARLYYVDLEGGTIRRIAYPAGNSHADRARDRDARPRPDAAHRRVRRQRLERPGGRRAHATTGTSTATARSATPPIAKPTFTYTTPGNYTARLRVTDAGGANDTVSDPDHGRHAAGRRRSTARRRAFTWAVGDAISFAGSAVDGQGNPIAAVRPLLAAEHPALRAHGPDEPATRTSARRSTGVGSGTMIAPNHDYPSRLELILTATDTHGLKTVEERDPRSQDGRHHAREHPGRAPS